MFLHHTNMVHLSILKPSTLPFAEFIKLALEKYRNLVSMFPYTSPDAITKLQCLNHCIAAIVNCKAYPDITKTVRTKYSNTFPKEF